VDHTYYSDGSKTKIAWTIESGSTSADQVRTHIDDYYDKLTIEQSKYVALHVGLFWGIGRFIIKNGDKVNMMLDLHSMFENLAEDKTSQDGFVNHRIRFIRQLISQRKLNVKFVMIKPEQNKSSLLLS